MNVVKKILIFSIVLTILLCSLPINILAETTIINTTTKKSQDNISDWIFAGAHFDYDKNYFVLTPDNDYWEAGAIWYNKPINNDFVLEMDYYSGVQDRPQDGADGIVVAFYANNDFVLPKGGSLGFDGCQGYGIEIDTYHNYIHNDESYNHIALIDENVSNHVKVAPLQSAEDGIRHHLKVEVIDKMCKVYVDNVLKLNHKIASKKYNWLGITASTGDGTNLHAVKNVSVSTDQKSFNDSLNNEQLNIELTHLQMNSQTSSFLNYKITATIKNSSSAIANNVKVNIELPEEMELIGKNDYQVGNISPNSTKKATWTVQVPIAYKNKNSTYTVNTIVNDTINLQKNRSIRYGFDDTTSIAIFTTEKSLTIEKNDSMWLAFGILKDNALTGSWEKMAITISDPTIVNISDYQKNEHGYSIEVSGKKAGTTSITVTDPTSGANASYIINVYERYVKSYSFDMKNMPTANDGLSTNIYDINGLYVSNYRCETKSTYYNVYMNIYNTRYHTGSVDVYDENNKWIASYPIEKYTNITSLWDTAEQTYYLVADALTGKWLTYQQATMSKCTSFMETPIKVPKNGYIVISNNILCSPGTYIFTVSEFLIDAATELLSDSIFNAIEDSNITNFATDLINNITSSTEIRDAWMDIFTTTLSKRFEQSIKNKLTPKNIKLDHESILDDFETALTNARITFKWKDAIKGILGVGQSAFYKFAGPAGLALKGCFKFTEKGSSFIQQIHIATSCNKPYVTLYSNVNKNPVTPIGITVETNGKIDSEAILQAFKISNSDSLDVNLDSNDPLEKYELYNISFIKNDKNVQPNGKVKVYVPIPKNMSSNTSKIYRQENDGTWTMLDAHVEGNYLVFETNHFSLYAVIGNKAELIIKAPPTQTTYSIGDTLNLEGLALEINGAPLSSGYICEPTIISKCGKQEITVAYESSTATFQIEVQCPDTTEDSSNYTSDESSHWQACSLCQSELNKETHDFNKTDAFDANTHTLICKCGKSKTENHTFEDWVITKEVSAEEPGIKEKTCACGYTETEEIPKSNDDTMSIKIIIIIICVSIAILILIGIVFFIVIKKKKSK